MKRAEIIAIGSELLTPYRVDTNSLWLTEQLRSHGISVMHKHVIGDNKEELGKLIREIIGRSDALITIGGLGPTFDDITKEALAEALELDLQFDETSWEWIQQIYRQRGGTPTENNRRQAMLPKGSTPVPNSSGTAPGVLLSQAQCRIASLPGPPDEMKAVFKEMKDSFFKGLSGQRLFTRIFKMAGIPESLAEDKLSDIDLPEHAEWSILASAGQVEAHLHVSAETEDAAEPAFEDFYRQLQKRLGDHLFSRGDQELEEVVGDMLVERDFTVAAAESCTGGLLSKRLTDCSGSSQWFHQSVVTYSNEAKVGMLGVSSETLETYGAVSSQAALEMARGIRQLANSTMAISITGIAGPTGGTKEKPVGTVYIACIGPEKQERCHRFLFMGDRQRVRSHAAQSALQFLRLRILDREMESMFRTTDS